MEASVTHRGDERVNKRRRADLSRGPVFVALGAAGGGARVDLKGLLAASRESGVMLASTSYIVVENAAQWRMLDVSERRKLDQNAALDFKEASAPSWIWVGAGFGLWVGFRRWRARGGRGC